MKIAVLGWGSLIWDSRNLESYGEWKKDGPFLPIEFARISNNSRLTLVLKQNCKPIQVLWNYMASKNIELARENLKERERAENIDRIGFVNLMDNTQSSRYEGVADLIIEWAVNNNIDGVIWTELGVRFKDKIKKDLNLENIISYLNSIPSKQKELAREYIVNAPEQIVTEYRIGIEENLNWKKRK